MDNFKNVLIVYFSGTGGTKRIADTFEDLLIKKGCTIIKHSLEISEYKKNKDKYKEILDDIDLVIMLYAVYAMDAPMPVYDWINNLPIVSNKPLAVISVSGGGEVWPNTSCRAQCIKEAEKHGFNVFYENMMVMPSNIAVSGSDHANMWLLKKIPEKSKTIINDILNMERRRTRLKISSRILYFLSKLEQKHAKDFAKTLKIQETCSGCGWCARNCPRENIEMANGKPGFKDKCIVCLRCVYGCPSKSLYSNNKWIILKEGYNLDDIEKRMQGIELEPIEKCCKGLVWSGVRKYLLNKDK
ncbi:MAG: EFR1 family ferrodoxin [Ignavibacteriales bacterium]